MRNLLPLVGRYLSPSCHQDDPNPPHPKPPQPSRIPRRPRPSLAVWLSRASTRNPSHAAGLLFLATPQLCRAAFVCPGPIPPSPRSLFLSFFFQSPLLTAFGRPPSSLSFRTLFFVSSSLPWRRSPPSPSVETLIFAFASSQNTQPFCAPCQLDRSRASASATKHHRPLHSLRPVSSRRRSSIVSSRFLRLRLPAAASFLSP